MKLKLAFLLAAIGASLTFGTAKADTVTYDFTGAGVLAGEDFTYVSTTGFLSLSTTSYAPTTETGGVTSFEFAPFIAGHELLTVSYGATIFNAPVTGLDPTTAGTENFGGVGTLVITDTPTVPEISGQNALTPLALLAGVILIFRSRRKNSSACTA